MPPVPKGSGYYLLQINYYFAELGYWSGHILFSTFVVFMILSVSRVLFIAFIATREFFRERKYALTAWWTPEGIGAPLVSIIVPAYNEEVNAVSSIESLLKGDYPNFEIIFVNDGSTDPTYDRVSQAFADNPKVKVYSKPNGGKASALNFGIGRSGSRICDLYRCGHQAVAGCGVTAGDAFWRQRVPGETDKRRWARRPAGVLSARSRGM